ncbi:zinc finger domain-containing protein [Hirsutella rhossiliensis]|uniref:Zinc finger domain-containing protein n=1 Tax=Hirsutella rhossiliensis TaxID=111463 RepID=A0A9P8N555_9HYPO|nr:zinc finger domain-containing protein [Hirsutella rhossiliensis]KAH0967125.1 zinc finger domain-containing protein [Hirsutella rhossiliensis]
MADPLLTSLCAICHTCSAACVKKHKAWSECSGERDATVFIPQSQLRTVAGVNHDYNFLHKLDLSVERAERMLVGDKGLVRQDELRPQTVQQVRWKTGRDGRKKKVLVVAPKAPKETGERRFERFLAHRLRQLNIQITRAPQGMARQRENNTTFNRRSGGINWQVEWLVLGDEDQGPGTDQEKGPMTRCLSKVLEDVPLYQAYQAVQDDRARAGRKKGLRSGRREEAQRLSDSKWNPVASSAQDPLTGHWRRQFRFFLGGPPTGSNLATAIAALEPTDCLRDILANTRLLEYPTLYVFKAGKALPAGFVVGPKDTVPAELGTKRRGAARTDAQGGRDSAKRRKQDREEGGLEEEEVDGSGEGEDENDMGGVGVEGAESGGGDDEEDSSCTSSSGTDGESD